MKKIAAILDISTFVWNQLDFNTNKHSYYQLIGLAPIVYEQVEDNRVPILLRAKLHDFLMLDFPYSNINQINPDYCSLTLSFLTKVHWISYDDGNDLSISTNPNIVKNYFSDDLKKESCSQILHIYGNVIFRYKYIAYNYFHNHTGNLLISTAAGQIEVDSLFYESEADVVQFFEQCKIKFKHSPKHDQYKAGGKISPFSCYNDRTGDPTKAQKLLSTSYSFGNDFYNFDAENEVYVRFVDSNDGTYHGFDVSDEGNNIPNEIKNRFNKNGRKF